MKRNHKTKPLRYYFVDEAGDGTLFDRRSARYGIYYTQKKPLTKAALEGRK